MNLLTQKVFTTYILIGFAGFFIFIGPIAFIKFIVASIAVMYDYSYGNVSLFFLPISLLLLYLVVTISRERKKQNYYKVYETVEIILFLELVSLVSTLPFLFGMYINLSFSIMILSWLFISLIYVWKISNKLVFDYPLKITFGGLAKIIIYVTLITFSFSLIFYVCGRDNNFLQFYKDLKIGFDIVAIFCHILSSVLCVGAIYECYQS